MLWLLACCPRFEDMTVTDGGVATPDMVRAVEQALADFASWTTAEGVCVPEVTFREELDHPDWLGAYDQPHEPIELVPQEPSYVYDAVLHELCHAWDGARSFPSYDEPELFGGGGFDREHYPTEYHQRSEALATACAGGLDGARMQAVLAARCPDVTLPGAWLLENVFDAGATSSIDDAPADITRATIVLPLANPYRSHAVSTAGVWGIGPWGLARWDAAGGWDLALDAPSGARAGEPALGGGEFGALWLERDGDGRWAVWARSDALDAWVEVGRVPAREDSKRFLRVTTTDRAWFFDVGAHETTWWALALDGSGVVEEGVIDGEVGEAAALGDEVWLLADAGLLVRAGDGWEHRLRLPHVPNQHGIAPLPGGSWVLPISADGPEDSDVVRTVARFDGETWSLPPDPCGADARIGESVVRSAGGRAALLERDMGLDEVRFAPLSW